MFSLLQQQLLRIEQKYKLTGSRQTLAGEGEFLLSKSLSLEKMPTLGDARDPYVETLIVQPQYPTRIVRVNVSERPKFSEYSVFFDQHDIMDRYYAQFLLRVRSSVDYVSFDGEFSYLNNTSLRPFMFNYLVRTRIISDILIVKTVSELREYLNQPEKEWYVPVMIFVLMSVYCDEAGAPARAIGGRSESIIMQNRLIQRRLLEIIASNVCKRVHFEDDISDVDLQLEQREIISSCVGTVELFGSRITNGSISRLAEMMTLISKMEMAVDEFIFDVLPYFFPTVDSEQVSHRKSFIIASPDFARLHLNSFIFSNCSSVHYIIESIDSNEYCQFSTTQGFSANRLHSNAIDDLCENGAYVISTKMLDRKVNELSTLKNRQFASDEVTRSIEKRPQWGIVFDFDKKENESNVVRDNLETSVTKNPDEIKKDNGFNARNDRDPTTTAVQMTTDKSYVGESDDLAENDNSDVILDGMGVKVGDGFFYAHQCDKCGRRFHTLYRIQLMVTLHYIKTCDLCAPYEGRRPVWMRYILDHEHSGLTRGSRVWHCHRCDNCSALFNHIHRIKTYIESLNYPQLCERCSKPNVKLKVSK